MKLLMIPSTMLPFPPVKGGAVQSLIKFYVEWNEKNEDHDIVIFSIYDENAKREAELYRYCNVQFIKIPSIFFKLRDSNNKILTKLGFKFIHVLYQWKICSLIKKQNSLFDEIILDNTPQFAESIAKAANKKVILHIYNDYLNIDTSNIDAILNNTSKVITVSDYISKRVIETNKVDASKVFTVHNGVELEKFGTDLLRANAKDLKREFKISDDETIILFVARLVPEKGIKQLIQAFNAIKDKNLHLIIVGNKLYGGIITDPFLLELKELAMQNYERIHFTGYIDYEKLPNYYAMADIGVLPSLYEEPFAMAAIEYMASKLAVIVSDAGGFPEMVYDAAIVVKRGEKFVEGLSEAIVYLSSNQQVLNVMKDKAYQKSKQYSSINYCTGLNDILLEECYE